MLHHLIAQGEHQQQDFKYEISDVRKIARTLSAFANTDGGRLLIGVKDNGKIAVCVAKRRSIWSRLPLRCIACPLWSAV